MFILIIHKHTSTLVDGGLSDWMKVGNCTKECRQKRVRYCNNPKPEGNGKMCEGETDDWVECYQHQHCNGKNQEIYFTKERPNTRQKMV